MVRLKLPAGLAAVAIAAFSTPVPAFGATTTIARPRADTIRDNIRLTGLPSVPIGSRWKADPKLACGTPAVPGRKGVSALVREGRVVLLAVRTSEIPTLSGVKVGDDISVLQNAYGQRLASDTADRFVYKPTDPKDQRLRMAFDVRDGKVAVIRAGLVESFGVSCENPTGTDNTSPPTSTAIGNASTTPTGSAVTGNGLRLLTPPGETQPPATSAPVSVPPASVPTTPG